MAVERIGRYRKVYPRLWRHPGFLGLKQTAREVTFYVLTGPQTNRIGLFNFSVASAAEDLNVGVETFRERLGDVCGTFGWLFDADARVMFIPSWWRWNPPENHNVLAGNLKDLNDIRPCGLVDAFVQTTETLPEMFHETLREGCLKRLLKPSGKQKQEQYSETEARAGRRSRAGAESGTMVSTIVQDVIARISSGDTDKQIDEIQYLCRTHKNPISISRDEALESLLQARHDPK